MLACQAKRNTRKPQKLRLSSYFFFFFFYILFLWVLVQGQRERLDKINRER